MKYTVIYDKGVGTVNEDQYFIDKNTFGVFDGASSLNKFLDKNRKTGGWRASDIAKNIFLNKTKTLKDTMMDVNYKIKESMLSEGIDISKKGNLWSTGAAVVQIKKNQMEWAQISDCLIIVINKDNSFKILVEDWDHDKNTFILWEGLKRQGVSDIRNNKIIVDEILRNRGLSGIEYGFLNGEKEALDFIEYGLEDISNAKYILLFTDGLHVPQENPSQKDTFDGFVDIFLDVGLSGLMKYVRDLENNDKDIKVYPRFKVHDDIAAIAITL